MSCTNLYQELMNTNYRAGVSNVNSTILQFINPVNLNCSFTKVYLWLKIPIHRFHCHAAKKMGNHPVEEAEKMKCYKRLTYKQFIQVSGLCGPQFLSYLPKRFTHPCRALYGDAILMYRFGAPIWRPEINKNIWGSLFLLKLFPFTRKLAYVGINIPSNTWNGYTAENQEERLFFNETAIPFSCHALWKRGSSNYYIFEIKHATEMETCTKIYFSFAFNLV